MQYFELCFKMFVFCDVTKTIRFLKSGETVGRKLNWAVPFHFLNCNQLEC